MAADRDYCLWIAATEYDAGVGMKDFPNRVLEYFKISTGKDWTLKEALTQSWCGHFVYWVLHYGGVTPVVKQTGRTIGRFVQSEGGRFKDYPILNGKCDYEPKPGDLYYQMYVDGQKTDHIGFVREAKPTQIVTVDGNSGPKNGNGFLLAYDKEAKKWKAAGMGAGMIYSQTKNRRDLTSFIDLTS